MIKFNTESDKMKKFILSLISSILIILMLFPIFSSAEAQLYGDIDKNGKVEASDARTVLRASVAPSSTFCV